MFHSTVDEHWVVSRAAELEIPLLKTVSHRTSGRPRQSIRVEDPGTAQGCVENKEEMLRVSWRAIQQCTRTLVAPDSVLRPYAFNKSSLALCFLLWLHDRKPGTGTVILKDS